MIISGGMSMTYGGRQHHVGNLTLHEFMPSHVSLQTEMLYSQIVGVNSHKDLLRFSDF